MEIPRDVLLAGVRAALAKEYPPGSLREDLDREAYLDRLAERQLDTGAGGYIGAAIAAAIEAWETRPHPWGELPATGTAGSLTDLVGLDPDLTGGMDTADYVAQQWADPPAPVMRVVKAAQAWAARIRDPINLWGDDEDHELAAAVEALATGTDDNSPPAPVIRPTAWDLLGIDPGAQGRNREE